MSGFRNASPPASFVSVDSGRVTVDVRDADLEDALKQIAGGGGFRLKTAGQLGTVTIAFAGLSLERALRRLAGDHELMLVYGATAAARGTSLLEVAVFAAPPSRIGRAVGRAATEPVASNASEEGRRRNRRIEIILVPLDERAQAAPQS